MPKIPRYEPRVGMTTQSPAAKQDPNMASVEGKAMAQMGQTLGEIGAKFVEIDIFTQKNEASVKWSQQQSEILTEAANDPNIDDVKVQGEYKQRLGEAYKETLGGFSIPRARAEFQSQADLQAIGSVSKLTQIGLKTKVAKGYASSQMRVEGIKEGYATANSAEVRKAHLADAFRVVDEGTANGFWDAKDAFEQKEKIKKDFSDAAVNVQISIDPDEAERQIVEGEIPDLSSEAKSSYLKIIETARAAKERKEAKELELHQTQKLLDVSKRIAEGTVQVADIYELMNNGELSVEMGQQSIENLNQLYPTTDKKQLVELYNRFKDPKASMKEIVGQIMASKLNQRDREDFIRIVEQDFQRAMRAGETKRNLVPEYRANVSKMLEQARKSANLPELWEARTWANIVTDVANGVISEQELPEAIGKAVREGIVGKIVAENPNLAGSSDPIADSYRLQAVRILKDGNKPVTKSNIDYLTTQLRQRDEI